jgi:hypothetical protein
MQGTFICMNSLKSDGGRRKCGAHQALANCGIWQQVRKWRATADEDGHYCFAVSL